MQKYSHLIFNTELPKECPPEPSPTTCGAVAANYLLESMFVTWDDDGIGHIDAFGDNAKEVLDRKEDFIIGEWPAKIDFGCLACGKCIRIMTEPFDSPESVQILE